jgi:thioredoxin-dependent peroxiredoxin
VGISADPADVLTRFSERLGTPFALVSDDDRQLITAYGVMKQSESKRAERCTFVIGTDGNIRLAYAKVKAKDHAAQVLADVKKALEEGRL